MLLAKRYCIKRGRASDGPRALITACSRLPAPSLISPRLSNPMQRILPKRFNIVARYGEVAQRVNADIPSALKNCLFCLKINIFIMLNISSSIHYIYDSTFGALFDKNKNLDPWIRRLSIEQKTELCKTIRCIEIVFRKYPNARVMINIQNNNSSGRFPYTTFSNEFEAAHALERHLLSQAPEIILNILDEFPLSISDVFDSFHIPQAAARAFCLMDLREATLKDWEMNNVQLPELDFSGARMEKVQLRGNDLSRIVMKNAFLYEVQFTSSNLTGADMSFTEGRTIDLKRCTLDDANLVSSSFDDIKLVHAKLNYTNLSGARLQNVYLFV